MTALCSLRLGNLFFLLQQDSGTPMKKVCSFDFLVSFSSQEIILFLRESQTIKKEVDG